MLEIIKKLTEEYENSGYPAVKSCFDKWLNEKKDITQKDEATVKLFMARICLAQEKFDDLAQFFNAGMSQTDKEELENLRRKNAELEEELERLKAEHSKLQQENYDLQGATQEYKNRISESEMLTFKNDGRFVVADGYAVYKDPWGPYSSCQGVDAALKRCGIGWQLLTRQQFWTFRNLVHTTDREIFEDCYVRDGRQYARKDMNGGWNGYIHPAYKIAKE